MDFRSRIYSGAAGLVRAFLTWTVSNPVFTLASVVFLTVVLGYWGFSIPLRTNIEDLFPETTPHVVRAKLAREKLASSNQVLIIAVSKSKDANIRFIEDLAAAVTESPLVSSVEYKRDISFFKENSTLFLDVPELEKLDRRLKKAIQKAVEKDLGPFDEDDTEGTAKAEKDKELVEDFGAPAASAKDKELVEDFAAPAAAAADSEEEEGSFEVPTEKEVKEKYGIASLSEYDTNADGTLIGLKIFPTFPPAEVTRSKDLLRFIDSKVKALDPASYSPDMDWTMEGDYHKKIEEMDVLYRDLMYSTFSALAMIFVLMAVFFRRMRLVLLTFIPLTAGLSWTLGFAYVSMGYLNLVTAFIFAVLSGLGVEYSMHVAERYMEEREEGKDPARAVVDALSTLSRAMFGSAVMTGCGFLALTIFDFRGFSQFGVIAGVGIPLCLLVVYLFFPPMVVLMHRIWPEKPFAKRLSVDRPASLFGSVRKARAVLAGVAVTAAVCLPGVRFADFEPDMNKVMTPSKEAKRSKLAKRYKEEVSRSSSSPIALLTDSIEETRKVHDYMTEHKSDFEHLQTVSSVFSFVPANQDDKKAIVDRMRDRLQKKMGALKGKDRQDAQKALEYLDPAPFAVDDLPEWVKKKFTDKDGNYGHFVILAAWGNKANAVRVAEITKEFDDIEVDGKMYHTSASYYILSDVYEIVRKEGPLALLLAAVAALIMVLLDFASIWRAAIAFFPVLLGVGCFVGVMGWMGENFTMFNMIILPCVFGTSIDTCTHVLHRLREEGAERIGVIANTTGTATFLGAMANTLGFGSLLFATNPGLSNIGMLAPLGLLLCWVICLTLTCSWGYLRERARQHTV